MKKIQLIESIYSNDNLDLNKFNAKKSVNIIIDSIIKSISNGNGVEIRGFGSFTKKYMKARVGINPRTGEKTDVEEKHIPFFKVGKELKNLVNNK